MRRTRSRKTHKRHAKRHTRRRGGMNAPGGKPGAERPTPRPGVNTNQGPAYRRPPPHAHLIEPGHAYALPIKNGRLLSYFPNAKNKNKNKGFVPPPPALPGSAAALAAAPKNGPFSGAPLVPQPANNRKKVTTKVMPEGSPGSPFF